MGFAPRVPAVASSFVGRAAECDALGRLLAEQRLVTVAGPGGCGKTRLATEWVRVGQVHLHGFVEVAAAGPQTDLELAVLAACGLREDPGRPAADLLRDRFGRAEGLLVLDNCEHLSAGVAALVVDLLRHCGPLRVLTTSRVTLGVAGEAVLPLTGLDPAGAVTLLLDRARRVQPGLPSGPATDAVAGEICRLADGLPLVIELAAAHARTLPLQGVRDGMADRMPFLAARHPVGLHQHRSVAASLDWSAGLVGEPARRALAALSVVDGRFPLEVALAVTGGARHALETLVDHSLVWFDAGDGRYGLLETVREYASSMLVTAGDTGVVSAQLLDWAAAFARDVRGGLERAEPDKLRRVDQADAAVSSALDHAVTSGHGLDTAARTVVDLAFGWSLRGRCGEGLARVRRIAAAFDPPPPALQWVHGFLAAYSGELETGFALAADAAARAGSDLRTAARAFILTGMVQAFVDPAGAEPVLAEAAELARAAGDDWGHVEAAQCRAYTHLFRGAYQTALSCADAVAPELARLGHGQLQAWDAAIHADIDAATGRFAAAEAEGRRGLELAVAIGEPVSGIGALLPLVRTLVATGRGADAAAVLDAGLVFVDSHPGLGTREAMAVAAAVVASAGDPETAATVAASARDEASGLPMLAAEAALLLAAARLRQTDAGGARAAVADARTCAAAFGSGALAVTATLIGAATDRADGIEAAAAHEALAAAHRLGLRPMVVDALALVSAIARDGGRPAVAARLHSASERLRVGLGAVVTPLAALFRPDAAFLDAPEHAAALAEGARLGLAGAVGYASRSRGRRSRPRSGWDSLTPTERDVVALAAQGLSNPTIAAQLLVSTGTVRTHLRSVYSKLGLANRTELAARAEVKDGRASQRAPASEERSPAGSRSFDTEVKDGRA